MVNYIVPALVTSGLKSQFWILTLDTDTTNFEGKFVVTLFDPDPQDAHTKLEDEFIRHNGQTTFLSIVAKYHGGSVNAIDDCIHGLDALFFITGNITGDCRKSSKDYQVNLHLREGDEQGFNSISGDYSGELNCFDNEPTVSQTSCLVGTQKDETLVDKFDQNCIDGKGGNDKIGGLAGNDKLNGRDGKDVLVGGNGDDELTGGNGADTFQCGPGNDKITDFSQSQEDIKSKDCEQF